MLRDAPRGDYRFLPGIDAFSSGTVAAPGHEIVHVTLAAPVPWRAGFTRIERHLREQLGEDNPIPWTNVAPVVAAPAEPSLYAFSYTAPGATPPPRRCARRRAS